MRKTRFALFGIALLAAAPAIALAQPGPGGGPGPGGRGPGGPRGMAALFEQADANRDGRVVWEEAWAFVQRRFAEADADRDGGLSEAELAQAMRQRGPRRPAAGAEEPLPGRGGPGPRGEEQLGFVFRGLDADRNGRVTLEELRPMVEARFRALDANMDNAITRDELPAPPPPRGGPGGERRGPASQ